MPRRRPLLAPLIAFSALAVAGCREPAPWQQPDWRPDRPPQRIVAASLLAAEVLLAIAPRERIAAVHELVVDPRFSLAVADAQGLRTVGAGAEQLLAVEPDLVICDAFTKPETLALLGAAAVPVVQTATPATFADVAANVRRIGRLCHAEPAAERLVGELDARLRALAAHAPALGAWRVANLDGALHTHGSGSLFEALARAAGAVPLAAERGVGPFRKLHLETLLGWDPDAIVVSGEAPADGSPPAWLAQAPGLQLLTCVRKRRIVYVPGPLLGSTSHLLAGAAERLQRTLRDWGRP